MSEVLAMEKVSDRMTVRATLVSVVFCAGLIQPIASAVKIISPLQNQVIKYRNQSVLFNCTVTPASSSGGSFHWLKGKALIQPFGIQNTSLWSSFELKNLSVQDEGEYSCSYGGSYDSVQVYLAFKPKAENDGEHSLISTFVDYIPDLECKARGWPKPSIYWMKDNRNISEDQIDDEYKIVVIPQGDDAFSVKSVLTIFSIQKENGGVYTCFATNAVGADKYNITVNVAVRDKSSRYTPTMTADQPKYTVERGKDATLVCLGMQVENFLLTFLWWELSGTKINTSSDHYMANETFFHQSDGATPRVQMRLTIFDVDFVDAGNYSCVVRSEMTARASDNILVEVTLRDKRPVRVWVIVLVCVLSFLLVLLLALLICQLWQRRKQKKKMVALAQKYGREARDNNFEHDVFVSYSTKDYDWIKDFLQPLFEQNNIKYIIHSRDFKPGKAFYENMADSVYNSRKVIVVMSANYLCSGFCKDELNMALFRSAQRDDDSLIVVKIEDMKPSAIPKILRHKTFIDYTSREETATWGVRILQYVRSANRLLSVTTDDGMEGAEASERMSLILNAFKIGRKKKRNNRELTDQA